MAGIPIWQMMTSRTTTRGELSHRALSIFLYRFGLQPIAFSLLLRLPHYDHRSHWNRNVAEEDRADLARSAEGTTGNRTQIRRIQRQT